jgi:hypothetical protein
MVGDFYADKWRDRPWYVPSFPQATYTPPQITRDEFDELKREVADMKELLKRAKEYDERTGQPDCEIDEKMMALLRALMLSCKSYASRRESGGMRPTASRHLNTFNT